MRIAAITLTMNDYHVVDQWVKFSDDYVENIYKHIIVHNTTNNDYEKLIGNNFPKSEILKRAKNGGTTGAYNTGIKKALEDKEVDAIMLIANDIKISKESVKLLYDFLFSSSEIGAVAPVLIERDMKTIAAYGENFKKDMGLDRLFHNQSIESLDLPNLVECQCIPGGINLVKREVYENVGLQDETLFMYFDENDFFKRVGQKGYKIFALKNALSYHYHIFTEGSSKDNSLAWFYINRNHIIVCSKYNNFIEVLKLFLMKVFVIGPKYIYSFLRDRTPKKVYYFYLGLFVGIIGYKKNFVKKH